jgi:hypothetical protein
LKFNLNLII